VGKFVDDYVVDDEVRRFDEPPVKIEIAFEGAGTPAILEIRDEYVVVLYAKLPGETRHFRRYLFFRLFFVPGGKLFGAVRHLVFGQEELPFTEPYTFVGAMNNIEFVVPTEIRYRLARYKWRLRSPLGKLGRMIDLLV